MPEPNQQPPGQPAAAGGAGFKDPFGAFSFRLDIHGVTQGHFVGLEGLGATIEDIEYREGGDGQVVHHLAGRVKYRPVTLRYGVTSSKDLWTWFEGALKGAVERRNVSIIMLQRDGTDGVRYNLDHAWPTSWSGSVLDSVEGRAAFEHCTLCYESITLAT
jgi:phage tail-like protein